MRRVIITAIVLSMMALYGCIISSSPASPWITMDTGDTVEFKVTAFPPNSDVTWTLELNGSEYDTSTGMTYTFTPEDAGAYNMAVDVVDPWGSTQTRVWIITVN